MAHNDILGLLGRQVRPPAHNPRLVPAAYLDITWTDGKKSSPGPFEEDHADWFLVLLFANVEFWEHYWVRPASAKKRMDGMFMVDEAGLVIQ